MSSTGAGYDFSAGVFSPDGRIFQVEYAAKAVENSGTAVGIKCVDGIVVAVEKVGFHSSIGLNFPRPLFFLLLALTLNPPFNSVLSFAHFSPSLQKCWFRDLIGASLVWTLTWELRLRATLPTDDR